MMSGGVRESLLSGLECENHATIVLDHARVRMWVIHGVLRETVTLKCPVGVLHKCCIKESTPSRYFRIPHRTRVQ